MLQCGAISPLPILSYVTASISGVLCLITVPGNLLICMAVYIDPYRRLRTPFNIVVANLAFADLIVGCITEPLSVYLHTKEGLGREITLVEIRAIHLSYFISCTASVLSISLLALERFMSISYSLKYKLYFKVRRFVLVSVLVWLVAVGLSTVYILTSYVFYTFVFINIAVFWTLGVTTFCYVKILRKLKKVEKRMKNTTDIGYTNAVPESVSSLSKPYVVKVEEKLTTYLQDEQRGVTINESDVKRGSSQIEESVNGEKSCSSELGHSSSYEIGASELKINNITNSSIEDDEVGSNDSNVGFNPYEEQEKSSHNEIEVSDQNSALRQLGDGPCSRKTKEKFNIDKRISTSQESIREKDSEFLRGGTIHDVCKTNVTTYNEQTSNKYNILVTKTYIIVSVLFLACYIPALLIIYTMNWCHTCSCTAMHIMRDLQFIIVIVNSSVNPFLYSIRFPHFRRAISKILQDMRNEVFY